MKSAAKTLSMALCAVFVLTPLAASSDEAFDIQSQVGPNPVLPDIQQYLFPPMHLASVVGWKNGEKPTVAPGLKIEALATDLQHPRSLYTLPNGDVLVVESKAPPPQPITRPKDIVMRFIEKMVTSGGDSGPSNRITLLRYDPAGGGRPPDRSFSTTSIRPSAWSWSAMISMSRTPTPSCATPTTPATRRSLRAA
jgi:glucose/arabinose dehydrogenase